MKPVVTSRSEPASAFAATAAQSEVGIRGRETSPGDPEAAVGAREARLGEAPSPGEAGEAVNQWGAEVACIIHIIYMLFVG